MLLYGPMAIFLRHSHLQNDSAFFFLFPLITHTYLASSCWLTKPARPTHARSDPISTFLPLCSPKGSPAPLLSFTQVDRGTFCLITKASQVLPGEEGHLLPPMANCGFLLFVCLFVVVFHSQALATNEWLVSNFFMLASFSLFKTHSYTIIRFSCLFAEKKTKTYHILNAPWVL